MNSCTDQAHTRQEAGFALLAALWLITVASILTTGALAGARAERRMSANATGVLLAQQAARAGVVHALVHLRSSADSAHLQEAPVPLFWNGLDRFETGLDSVLLTSGAWYSVTLEDASSRLPLNDASVEELSRFFAALNVATPEAAHLAASIADWRDSDDLHRGGGGEWPDYYSLLPFPIVPRNGPFRSVEELKSVRGMTPALYARCAPMLSLDMATRINLNSAPEPVLHALSGLGDEAVRALLARRRERAFVANMYELEQAVSATARAELRRNAPELVRRITFEPRLILIRAVGHAEAGAGFVLVEATASLAGGDIRVASSLVR
jgi:general secretion pathway protein K